MDYKLKKKLDKDYKEQGHLTKAILKESGEPEESFYTYLLGVLYDFYKRSFKQELSQTDGEEIAFPFKDFFYTDMNYESFNKFYKYCQKNQINPVYYISAVFSSDVYRNQNKKKPVTFTLPQNLTSHADDYNRQVKYDRTYFKPIGDQRYHETKKFLRRPFIFLMDRMMCKFEEVQCWSNRMWREMDTGDYFAKTGVEANVDFMDKTSIEFKILQTYAYWHDVVSHITFEDRDVFLMNMSQLFCIAYLGIGSKWFWMTSNKALMAKWTKYVASVASTDIEAYRKFEIGFSMLSDPYYQLEGKQPKEADMDSFLYAQYLSKTFDSLFNDYTMGSHHFAKLNKELDIYEMPLDEFGIIDLMGMYRSFYGYTKGV